MSTVLGLLAVLVVLFVAAAVATREGDVLADAPRDAADLALPPAAVQPEDVAEVRFGLALRGYRMREVDEVLGRLARELAHRDQRITELERALAEVVEPHLEQLEREQAAAAVEAVPAEGPAVIWPATTGPAAVVPVGPAPTPEAHGAERLEEPVEEAVEEPFGAETGVTEEPSAAEEVAAEEPVAEEVAAEGEQPGEALQPGGADLVPDDAAFSVPATPDQDLFGGFPEVPAPEPAPADLPEAQHGDEAQPPGDDESPGEPDGGPGGSPFPEPDAGPGAGPDVGPQGPGSTPGPGPDGGPEGSPGAGTEHRL
ncbi:MAG: DivIVA domain-containing protein [Mycobacteriales bacterium]